VVERLMNSQKLPYFLILPSIIFLFMLTIYPMLFALYHSFLYWMIGSPVRFIGLENYINVISSSLFQNALIVTLKFSGIVVAIELFLGLITALIIAGIRRGQGIISAILVMPISVAPVVAGIIFRNLYMKETGVVDYLLTVIGLPPPPEGILGNSNTAFLGLIVTDVWEWTPFIALIILASLLSLPSDIIEAAKVDGASDWQVFRYIKLPLIKPTIFLAAMLRFMQAYNTFDIVYVETRGGPGIATQTLSYHLFLEGLAYFHLGYASALTVVVSLIAVVLINIYLMFTIFKGGS